MGNLVLPKLDSRDLSVFELDFRYGFGGELITLYFSFMVTFLCVCFDDFFTMLLRQKWVVKGLFGVRELECVTALKNLPHVLLLLS